MKLHEVRVRGNDGTDYPLQLKKGDITAKIVLIPTVKSFDYQREDNNFLKNILKKASDPEVAEINKASLGALKRAVPWDAWPGNRSIQIHGFGSGTYVNVNMDDIIGAAKDEAERESFARVFEAGNVIDIKTPPVWIGSRSGLVSPSLVSALLKSAHDPWLCNQDAILEFLDKRALKLEAMKSITFCNAEDESTQTLQFDTSRCNDSDPGTVGLRKLLAYEGSIVFYSYSREHGFSFNIGEETIKGPDVTAAFVKLASKTRSLDITQHGALFAAMPKDVYHDVLTSSHAATTVSAASSGGTLGVAPVSGRSGETRGGAGGKK